MSKGAIAVAVDGSEASAAALAYATGVARTEGRPLAGIFVLDTGWADYIGNDWQSAAGARQGFLDYIREQLEAHAEAAREQFAAAAAAADFSDAEFAIVAGDPLDTLCEMMAGGKADVLVAGREVFHVCGRPSVRTLTRELPKRVRQQVVII